MHTRIYTESRCREINPLVHCELPASKRHKNSGNDTGKSQYPYNLFIGDNSIEIETTLKIACVVGV